MAVLLKDRFELISYIKCVTTKNINVKQCPIGCYLDDNTAGHVDDNIVDEAIAKIEDEFPGLAVQCGARLD